MGRIENKLLQLELFILHFFSPLCSTCGISNSSPFSLVNLAGLGSSEKTDSKIYKLMCEQLKLKPQDCLYIGNGDNNELDGASQVGINAIRILYPNDVDPYHLTKIKWNGDEISTLKEILGYL